LQKDKAILITGATGLVGSHLCRLLLSQGYTRLSATRRSASDQGLLEPKIQQALQWRNMELEDYFSVEAALAGIDIVIHCAALVSFQARDKNALLRINRVGTRHIVNAALHQKVDRLIYLSSVAALGRNTNGFPINEDSKWEDSPEITHYSRSKFLAELEVWRGQAEGLSVAVLYPSIILGSGHWHRGSSQLFSFANSSPNYYPTGHTGLVDVKDVVNAIELTVKRNNDGDRFLLNGTNISYQALLTKIAIALGKPPPKKKLPRQFAFLLTCLDKWRALLFGSNRLLSKESVRNAYHQFVYDSEKSEKELGLVYTDFDHTITTIANSFLRQQNSETKKG
jgi:nucleoside-diphosphate-sugar epimerase